MFGMKSKVDTNADVDITADTYKQTKKQIILHTVQPSKRKQSNIFVGPQ
jgi:hypothetical protein